MSEGQHKHQNEVTPEERERIANLLGFAEELLNARNRVQMEMQAGLGVFHETDCQDLPGVDFDCEDGSWLRVTRQRETRAPAPP